MPVATGRIGAASIPAVGELVLVQFVGGDVNAPVITGRLYNDEDRPPANEDGKAVLHLPARRRRPRRGPRRAAQRRHAQLVLKLGTGLELTLQDDDPAVKVDVGGNGHADDRQGRRASRCRASGKVELKGDGDLRSRPRAS